MSVEENKAVVQSFWDEWNRGNIEGMLSLIDDKAQDHAMPPGFGTDKQAVRGLIGMYMQAFPGIQVRVEQLIGEGDKVACLLTFTGTHTGEFMGMPPTGKTTTTGGITIFRVENGKTVERWANQDDLGLLIQLGVIPVPAGA